MHSVFALNFIFKFYILYKTISNVMARDKNRKYLGESPNGRSNFSF
jgi:hypothetical protein